MSALVRTRFKRLLVAAERAEQVVDADGGLNARVRDVSACANDAGNPRVFAGAHRYLLNTHPTMCWDHRNISACFSRKYGLFRTCRGREDAPVLLWIFRVFISEVVFLNNTIGDLQKNPIRKEV